jgi:hypothetical protein
MKYSPKLRTAMDEIKAIIRKHDIAAVVVLHTHGNGEHFIKVDPSYSCAKILTFVKGESGISIKSNEIPKEKKHQVITDTVNMFGILCDLVGEKAMALIKINEMLEKKLDIESSDGTHTDGREFDN